MWQLLCKYENKNNIIANSLVEYASDYLTMYFIIYIQDEPKKVVSQPQSIRNIN